MATQKQDGLFTDTAEGSVDLTDKEYYFATRASNGKIALCGNEGVIAGVISEGKAAGLHSSFNNGGGGLKVIAGEAIAINDAIASNADGKAKVGTTNSIGKATSAAAAGEMVEFLPDRT